MTGSQIITAVAGAAAIIAEIGAKLTPLASVLPPSLAKWMPAVIVVAGVIASQFNQSLSGKHVSVPVERITLSTAEKLGVSDQVKP